jgi:hypothetical protein
MMYLDVDVAKGTTFGVAPAIGFFGQISGCSYTENGEEFKSVSDMNFVFGSQSATATDNKHFYMASFWQKGILDDYYDGVTMTNDGGATLQYFDWGFGTQARYGAYPSNTTWFISGGTWPAQKRNTFSKGYDLTPRFRIRLDGNLAASVEINTEKSAMGNSEGYLGVIGRTRNGGQTFEVVYNDTNRFYFNGIDCADVNNCWAVAEGPEGAWILATNDGGDTWKEQHFVAGGGLFDVKMVNSKEGWAVGASLTVVTFNALFLHTQDGGETWVNANSIENAWPNSITVVNSDRAYATAFLRSGLSSILAYK